MQWKVMGKYYIYTYRVYINVGQEQSLWRHLG